MTPRYPVYVPSKGRFERCLTARFLEQDECPFFLVVEPQEEPQYRQRFPHAEILVLPWSDHRDENGHKDGLIAARNWIRDHAEASGNAYHWQIDDNCAKIARVYQRRRIRCNAGTALSVCEDFCERYTNVGIAGLNYWMFIGATCANQQEIPPFRLNCHVYSCSFINHAMPYRWRLRYNDDTDICLQALAGGWCTVQVMGFAIEKMRTMTVKGGNTDALYQGDGRCQMARMLERQWPGIVQTKRRFGRPQHVIDWKRFRNEPKLIRKAGIEIPDEPNEYGMVLKRVKPARSKASDAV